jgi:WD40 repeat protein
VLAGTPVPIPNEPITPENVDQIQELAIWGKGQIKEVMYSPDGRLLVIGSSDGMWFYDAKTLDLLYFIESGVMDMTFTPDSTILVSWKANIVSSWDTNTGMHLGSLDVGEIYKGNTVVSSNGTVVAIVSGLQQVSLWNIGNQKMIHKLEYDEPIFRGILSPDGLLLATQTENDTIFVSEVATGENLYALEDISKTLADGRSKLAFSLDGSLLATGNTLGEIQIWEARSGTLLQSLPSITTEPEQIIHLLFSPTGKLLAVSKETGNIQLWDTKTGSLLQTLKGSTPGRGQHLSFSPDETLLVSDIDTSSVALWNVINGEKLHTLDANSTLGLSTAFSIDGKFLAVAEQGKTVQLWDTMTGVLLGPVDEYMDNIETLTTSVDETIFTSHAFKKEIYLWDIGTGQVMRSFTGQPSQPVFLDTSTDGMILASEGGGLRLVWDVQTGQVLQSFEWPAHQTNDLALSPDGKLIAFAEKSSGLPVYDLQSGESPRIFRGHAGPISNVVFSPDGTILASSSAHLGDFSAILWDVETGKILHQLRPPSDAEISLGLAFSPDNKIIATGYVDGTIRLWDVDTGQLKDTYEGHTRSVRQLDFSYNGTILASGSEQDGTVRLWDMDTGALLWDLDISNWPPRYVHFTDDDLMLIIGSTGGTVRLWGIPPE